MDYRLVDELLAEAPSDQAIDLILSSQVNCLMDIGAFREVHMDSSLYHNELTVASKVFQWRLELAAIGLRDIVLVDFRLSGRFLAEASGIRCDVDPNRCKNFQGVVTPQIPHGVRAIQLSHSRAWNKSMNWYRENLHTFEQGGIVKEGFTAYLFGGDKFLGENIMFFPGSIPNESEMWNSSQNALYLDARSGKPEFGVDSADFAHEHSGSLTRGK
jgi:hypothetical protein